MNSPKAQFKKYLGLTGAICGSLLIGLPAIAQMNPSPQMGTQQNQRPTLFNESQRDPRAPLLMQQTPTTRDQRLGIIQPPLPETRQAPSTTIRPVNGIVNIRLRNNTNTGVVYEVIGDTNQRLLRGRSDTTLRNLRAPITLTFYRPDGGLVMARTTPGRQPGELEVTFTETTNLGLDRSALMVNNTGSVFLN